MSAATVFAAMAQAVEGPSGQKLKRKFKGSVLFKISDTDESFYLDLKSDIPKVCKGEECDETPDLIISVESINMSKMISGELKPQQAFMKGKLKVKGKMNLAMKLTTVLAATRRKMPKSKL